MGKIYELTIKTSYLPGWGLLEFLREILQNARDSEIEFGAKMTVEHVYRVRNKQKVGTLIVTNTGTTMSKEVLLFGQTSKATRGDLSGQFGEGLKIGCMVGLRLGLDIKIRNGDETWIPSIGPSDKFNADVLKFDITGGNKYEERIQVEILGIEQDTWEFIQKKFLFLKPPIPQSVIDTHDGRVLLSPEHTGNIYVKGMYVCHDKSLAFGYDVYHADIDRDRRMINGVREVTSKLLSGAVKSGRLTDKIFELLHENAEEVTSLCYYTGTLENEQIAGKFVEKYGDAVPVTSQDEVTALSHLGKRAIKVPASLHYILKSKYGSPQDIIKNVRRNTKHVYCPEDLTNEERARYEKCLELLREALVDAKMNVDLAERVTVVDFADSSICGTFDSNDRSINLGRGQLVSASRAMRTLIHEAAHEFGGDGSKEHESAIGSLTQAVLAKYLD